MNTAKWVIGVAVLVMVATSFLAGPVRWRPFQTEWEALNEKAKELYLFGNFDRALKVAKQSLEVAENLRGPSHPDVAVSLNKVAACYATLGQPAEAEPLLVRSLAIHENIPEPDPVEMGKCLHNLATVLSQLKKYGEAEPVFMRALALRERVLGKDDLDVATTLANLSLLYQKTGRIDEAEAIEARMREIWAIKR